MGPLGLCNPAATDILLTPQMLVRLFLRGSLMEPQTHYVAEAVFELLILFSCLYLPSAGTIGMPHHANLIFILFF